ncbi:MAG: Rpn family recombination-promoting nuclease/putative transposase [Thermoguttaceae bacterium]
MSSPSQQKVDSMLHPPNAERLDQDEFSFDITHDQFFKETFGLKPIAIAFLKIVLDLVLLKRLDLNSLTVEDTNYLDARFKKFHADVVYRVPLWDGESVLIHVVIEHKSENDLGTIFQLANYVMQVHVREAKPIEHWNTKTRLSSVIPVIFHQGKSPFTGATELGDLICKLEGADQHQMRMQAILFDLSKLTIETIPYDPDCPEFWPVLMIMKVVFNKRDALEHIGEILLELKPYSDVPYYLRLIRLCVHYVGSHSNKLEKDEMQQIDNTIQDTVGNVVPRFTNYYYTTGYDVGKAEGVAEGKAEGKAEGEVLAILTVLKARFGLLPQNIPTKVYTVNDFDRLAELTALAATCKSLKEFEASLG